MGLASKTSGPLRLPAVFPSRPGQLAVRVGQALASQGKSESKARPERRTKDGGLQLTVAGLRWKPGLLHPTIAPFLGLPKMLPLSSGSLCWHVAGVEGRQLHGLEDPGAVPAHASVPHRAPPCGCTTLGGGKLKLPLVISLIL